MRGDQNYVIDLCDAVLRRTALREHRFDFLRGDPGRSGRCARLPVDAYYPDLALVIEFHESQHARPTPFFDKVDRLTVSGVHRGEHRRLYDGLRRNILPAHGLSLVEFAIAEFACRGGRLARIPADREIVRGRLGTFMA